MLAYMRRKEAGGTEEMFRQMDDRKENTLSVRALREEQQLERGGKEYEKKVDVPIPIEERIKEIRLGNHRLDE